MDEKTRYSESERRQYEESRKDYWDYYSTVTTAEKKGRAEGRAEGMEKGMEKGKLEANLENARKMKEDQMPLDLIAKYTGLTAQEIEML